MFGGRSAGSGAAEVAAGVSAGADSAPGVAAGLLGRRRCLGGCDSFRGGRGWCGGGCLGGGCGGSRGWRRVGGDALPSSPVGAEGEGEAQGQGQQHGAQGTCLVGGRQGGELGVLHRGLDLGLVHQVGVGSEGGQHGLVWPGC